LIQICDDDKEEEEEVTYIRPKVARQKCIELCCKRAPLQKVASVILLAFSWHYLLLLWKNLTNQKLGKILVAIAER
jgi:hypothetical protein